MKYSDIDIKNKKIRDMEPLLKQWINNHRSYAKNHKNACLHWHSEGADVSVLVGAIWKCGEFALAELKAEKGRKERYLGRGDLWFTWRNRTYSLEAKQAKQIHPLGGKDVLDKIKKSLDEAVNAAAEINAPGDTKIGVCFIFPTIPEKKSKKETEKLLETFINEIKDNLKYDLFAYYFRKDYEELKGNDNHYCPVSILIGKLV